jgi:exonuclease III
MKVLSWNCQGLGNPKTVRALKKLIAFNHPDIIFLMETKTQHVQSHFKDKFAASYSFISFDCIVNGTTGRSGGIMMLWDPCTCVIDINKMEFNYIDVSITNLPSNTHWRATGVYGYPKHHEKHLTCDLLNNLKNSHNSNNWLIFGDFNIVLNSNEKLGGNPIDLNLSMLFKDTINSCGL